MEHQLVRIINILQKLNSLCQNVITKDEMEDCIENIGDFRMLMKELDELLERLESRNEFDKDEIEKDLFELHRILATLEWYFSEVGEINEKILKHF
ncbi:hypothetical protein [Anoxybacteroides rupiense]|uniref:hypothetical protein n=1 Tax=Anoxybacteroides rupiense TaxID=311460 RepID=UPI00160598E8|nr:hypothetical protein [Anoxybacillus rupiensis]MBB3907319.1 hypothetical protein [Anoxybacillus rupiensis]